MILFSISSCEKTTYESYKLATPITLTLEEFRNSAKVMVSQNTQNSGKIYAYGDYIFVNDKKKGIHVIDNQNPSSPRKVAFINIPGNMDISIKDNYLYADSLIDLVVFDISDMESIHLVERLEDVFPNYTNFPFDADYYDWSEYNSNDIVVDWTLSTKYKLIDEVLDYYNYSPWLENITLSSLQFDTGQVGTGGSLARFKIVKDYLYAVDRHSIHVFNIQNLETPVASGSVYAGFDIETIFNKDQYLFLGSMSGMFVYDISQADSPEYVSEFRHGTACDPVIVDGNYAYITLRGGNSCGAFESSLQIVDISDINNPTLEISYSLSNPYGLGVKDEKLFICDGTAGLKVFDKTNNNELKLLNHFKDINAFDVISLEDSLLLIGENTLYQYRYTDNNIELLSSFPLN